MSCPTITTIYPTDCVGNSLGTIMSNFKSLTASACDNDTRINFIIAQLSALQLSATRINNNVLNINTGNYPYVEVAYVCAPNATSVTVSTVSATQLPINTVVSNTTNLTGVNVYISGVTTGNLTPGQFSLSQGTYNYNIRAMFSYGTNYVGGIVGLWNASTQSYITRSGPIGTNGAATFNFSGQFTVPARQIHNFEVHGTSNYPAYITNVAAAGNQNGTIPPYFNSTEANGDQRTTVSLWKVG